jgi:hypothetical protein
MNSTTDKLAEALRDFLEEADAGIVATPCTREAAREALAALEAKPAEAKFIDGDCVIGWVSEPKRAPSPAAPELLEALQALEPLFDGLVCYASTMSEYEPNRLIAQARAAIAKATGEPAAPAPVQPAFVDEWEHGCNALLTNIKLWTARCPHCGKPAPEASTGGKP